MEDDKQNYDLMGNFVKCLHDTYDKNKIKKYIIAHQTVQKVPYIPFSDLEPVTSEKYQAVNQSIEYKYAEAKQNEKHNRYQKTRCDMAEKLDGSGR